MEMMKEMKKRGQPFTPSEAALMSYIDHVASTDEAASLISCLDLWPPLPICDSPKDKAF